MKATIKAPHTSGPNRFEVSNLQSMVSGAVWLLRLRIGAPSEAPGFDYLSFEVVFPSRNNSAFHWTANTEVKAFPLSNTGACLGGVTLLENGDAFMLPNSMDTNPGNQIDIFGLGSDNVYLGNYDVTLANCADPDSDMDGVIDSLDQDDDGLTGTVGMTRMAWAG